MLIVIVGYPLESHVILCPLAVLRIVTLIHNLLGTRNFIQGSFLELHRVPIGFGGSQSIELVHQSNVLFPQLPILLLQLGYVLFFEST